MRWQNERQSENVEDRRGVSAGQIAVGGGIGTILIVLLVSLLTGADPRALLQRLGGQQAAPRQGQQAPVATSPEEKRQAALVKTTLALTEDVWTDIFAKAGRKYEKPFLVLFRDRVKPMAAEWPAPQWGRFIARPTRKCTSTSRFTRSSRADSRPRANSPRRT